LERWLASLELLARFPHWADVAGSGVEWLWRAQHADGWWDFGARVAYSTLLPLANDWRMPTARRFDWSARVLLLLRRYYDSLAEGVETRR
jgi:hypothetical protein